MIKTSTLEEYSSLQTLRNYCISRDECGQCGLYTLCCCMALEPSDWDVKYTPGKENEHD